MADTHQSAMGPYVAVAAIRSALNAWTAVSREALVVKVFRVVQATSGGLGEGGGGEGDGSEGDGGGGDGNAVLPLHTASVRVVEERGAGDVLRRVVAPLRPVAAVDNADRPALKAVKKNGATLVVDAKAHPHAGGLRDSVLPRQLSPSAGLAVGPPVVAAGVFGAAPPVLGQVGAHKHSTADGRALCAAGTAKCTEGESVARSRLHAIRASRQARLGELRRALGVDEAQRVRTVQRGRGHDTESAAFVCGAGAGRGGARAAARHRASVREERGEHTALHEAVGDQVDGAGAPRLVGRGEAVRHGRRWRRGRRWWQRRRRQWRRRHGRRVIADGGLKQYEIARKLSKILCEDCLGRDGGDMLQRRQAHPVSEAPCEHSDTVSLDERRRVDARLPQRLARRCVDRLLAVREEQHDLGRAHAAIVGEELPRGFKAVGDRGFAVR
eukprot:scaffold26294_cov60-Phaeocystis_antarctica.AAC.3